MRELGVNQCENVNFKGMRPKN